MEIPSKISSELAEEVGWHIGDGSMNFYKNYGKDRGFYQLRGHIKDDKLHYLKRIKPLFKKLYSLDLSLREMPSTQVFGFQIWRDDLVNFKKKLGLPLGRKDNISIPQIFFKNKNLKKAVLRGIFDTDGGIYLEKKNNKLYPRIYITTISFELSKQLLELFKEFNIRATRYSQLYNQEFKRKRAYIITIRGSDMFHNFMRLIKPQNPKHLVKYRKFIESQNL